jgi:hypothetical protein
MATLNRQDVLNLLHERKDLWRQRYGITRLGLFGSLARDEAGPEIRTSENHGAMIDFGPVGLYSLVLQPDTPLAKSIN